MDGVTQYRNTDLDLTSADDLTALAAALEVRGLALMRGVTRLNDGQWSCGFSLGGVWYDEPEPNIAAMLAVIEALDPPLRSAWAGCSRRVFDIGYDCGQEPFAFNQGLSAEILGQMAAAGASLRVTLYPDRDIRPAEPGAAADPARRGPTRNVFISPDGDLPRPPRVEVSQAPIRRPGGLTFGHGVGLPECGLREQSHSGGPLPRTIKMSGPGITNCQPEAGQFPKLVNQKLRFGVDFFRGFRAGFRRDPGESHRRESNS